MMPMCLSSIPLLLVLSLQAQATVYLSFGELKPIAKYDFIVVGSGPGGSTIASRLTENPKVNVLLIEAGPNNEGASIDLQVPAFNQQIPSTYTWNYTTAPSPSVNNRSLPYARGYVLGGTSSINGMVYSRGAAENYDGWAQITGDKGWSWDSLWSFTQKNERLVPPAGGRNTSGEFDPRFHSFNGTVPVSLPTFGPTDFDKRCLESARLQNEFGFNVDMNSGRPIGLTWSQHTIGGGERSSAATTYLNPTVRRRPNLSILANTYVTRVLPTQGVISKEQAFLTVELGDHSTRRILGKITASKEVILSAGVFGTPQILLNSGIGDAKGLRGVGVTPTHSLPLVGKNMQDHVGALISWTTKPSEQPPVDPSLALAEWTVNRTGSLTDPGNGNMILWSRISSSSDLWKKYPDPSSGPHTPHLEFILLSIPAIQFAGTFVVLLSPTSRGSVTLRSNNPFDDPIIEAPLLKTKYDVLAMKEGYRLVTKFLSGPAWSGYLFNGTSPNVETITDAAWETYIRGLIDTSVHGVGTAAITKDGGQSGVVDSSLRVIGLRGLRIVDASVIPVIPTGHTQVPTYLIAERAASLVKSSWKI